MPNKQSEDGLQTCAFIHHYNILKILQGALFFLQELLCVLVESLLESGNKVGKGSVANISILNKDSRD